MSKQYVTPMWSVQRSGYSQRKAGQKKVASKGKKQEIGQFLAKKGLR
jgi:hypothetical protein